MSNSSERHAPLDGADDAAALLRLLEAASRECALLAADIARTGETVSALGASRETADWVMELQSFDALAQGAMAQAELLSRLAAMLQNGDTALLRGPRDWLGFIPLPEMRARLARALGHHDDAETEDETHLLWLEGP